MKSVQLRTCLTHRMVCGNVLKWLVDCVMVGMVIAGDIWGIERRRW